MHAELLGPGPVPDGEACRLPRPRGLCRSNSGSRSAAPGVYADFLIPHLTPDVELLDVGCGRGRSPSDSRITWGAWCRPGGRFDDARGYAEALDIDDLEFRVGDVYALDLPDDRFDASEYGGLIPAGPDEPLLRRFYAIRAMERTWNVRWQSPDAFAAFARGRALGWKPEG